MAKTNNGFKLTTVTVHIEPGPATEQQHRAWQRLWRKLLANATQAVRQ